jgi:hypothetical protein
MNKLIEILTKHMENRLAAEQTNDPIEKGAKARDAVVGMLGFVQFLLGDDVMRAAYGEIDPTNREEMFRIVALRVHTASMVFARMPDDAGSLGHIAEDAMAVGQGDAPIFFARPARKRSWRVAKAKFIALAWDAYLEALEVPTTARHSAIVSAFGNEWDTISRWIKAARAHLGDQFVDYHLGKARVEGLRRQPYSLSITYHEAKLGAPMTWEALLARDGERFKAIHRASRAA